MTAARTSAAAVVIIGSLALSACGDDRSPDADDSPPTSVGLDPQDTPTIPESTVPSSTAPPSTLTLRPPRDPNDPDYPTVPPPTTVSYPSIDPSSS